MKRSLRTLLTPAVALLALGMAGCGSSNNSVTNPISFNDPDATEPTAGTWKTWVLDSPSQYRPAAPAAQGSADFQADLTAAANYASQRTSDIQARIDFWDGGVALRWNEYLRTLIQRRSVNPPRASRAFALLSVAMYDAMVASYDAKYHYNVPHPSQFTGGPTVYGTVDKTPSYVSERTAMARAACDVLAPLFPLDAGEIAAMYGDVHTVELYSGNHFPSDVNAGEQIGISVAALVNARRANGDNSGAAGDPLTLTGDSVWVPTPPGYVNTPQEPGCGKWTPWVLASGSSLRPANPPVFLGPEFDAQRDEVYNVNLTLTDDRKNLALFWADGSGTVTPPGHWNQIAADLGVSRGLDEPRMARMLALLGVAQADAFISCWECKYHYWEVRPVTVIEANGHADWLPFIVTPAFPSYPSGHSSTSGAAATVLGYIFPDDALSLHQMGTEAMNSRLYGGIHFSFDNLTGFNMGSTIGARVVAIASRDGSPARPALPDRLHVLQALRRSPGARPMPSGARLDDMAD